MVKYIIQMIERGMRRDAWSDAVDDEYNDMEKAIEEAKRLSTITNPNWRYRVISRTDKLVKTIRKIKGERQ